MPDPRLEIIVTAVDQTAKAFQNIGRSLEAHRRQFRNAGLAMTGFAAAGVAAFGLTIKAAQEAQVTINQLSSALAKLGLSYEGLRGQIENTIKSLERKTNFSDEEQRIALQTLISLSGDYESSLRALPTVLDVATGLHLDLATAANLVGRGISGNTELFARYGLEIAKGATATELITKLTEQFGGQAMAAANPFKQLTNAINNFQETIGVELLPIVQKVVVNFTEWISKFEQLHPELRRFIIMAGLMTIAVSAIGGGFLLMLAALPSVIGGIGLLVTAFMHLLPIAFAVVAALLQFKMMQFVLAGWLEAISWIVRSIANVLGFLAQAFEETLMGIAIILRALPDPTGFTDRLAKGFEAAAGFADRFGTRLDEALHDISTNIHEAAKTVFEFSLLKTVGDAISDAFSAIKQRIKEATDEWFNFGQQSQAATAIAIAGVRNLDSEIREIASRKRLEEMTGIDQVERLLREVTGVIRPTIFGAFAATAAGDIAGGRERLEAIRGGAVTPDLMAFLRALTTLTQIQLGAHPEFRGPGGTGIPVREALVLQVDGRTLGEILGVRLENEEQTRSS